MDIGALGKECADGDIIVKQGDSGNNMFIVQKGHVDVIVDGPEGEIVLSELGRGDVFGEMALFTRHCRSATVRSKGNSLVLTIDKRGFFKCIHEDTSLAFRILKNMAERVQKLDEEVVCLRGLLEEHTVRS
jgi:CRP-like cAMP-binding protein